MTRRDNHRFLVSFWLTQVVLFSLVSLNYLSIHFLPSDLWAWGYWLVTLIGQMALLSFVLAYLLPNVVSLLCPWRPLCVFMAVSLSSLGLIGLLIDSIVYQMYHDHINLIIIRMILSPAGSQIFHFTAAEWLSAGSLLTLMITIVCFTVWMVLRDQEKKKRLSGSKWAIYFCFFCLLGSHLVHAWADVRYVKSILMIADNVPLYKGLTAQKFLEKHKLMTVTNNWVDRVYELDQHKGIKLHYPEQALQMKKPKHLMNIIFIVIDDWRYDTLNAHVTPHMYQFSQHAFKFNHHISGGNSTAAGIFSLFYSLPSNYFQAFTHNRMGPVLFKTLNKMHYDIGIYQSASQRVPPFYHNVFSDIKHLRIETPGKGSVAKDLKITQDAKIQINKAIGGKKPFFTFLFYDALHAYTFPSHHFNPPFQPTARINRVLLYRDQNLDIKPYWNQYRNAAYYVDSLVGDLLNFVQKKGLLKDTIVMITADHSEEFNDNHMGYWGHNGNYTPAQTHVPMIVFWPGKRPKHINYLTTGYDIVPTLMHDALGVGNPYKDYSVGHHLLHRGGRPYVIIGGYSHQGIVQPKLKKILSMKGRMYTLTDDHAHPLPDAKLDMSIYQQAFKQMHRFYQ